MNNADCPESNNNHHPTPPQTPKKRVCVCVCVCVCWLFLDGASGMHSESLSRSCVKHKLLETLALEDSGRT